MSLGRLLAISRKELRQILRDMRSLAIVIVMPVMLLFIFGYAVTLDIQDVRVLVFDRDGSQESQDLLRHFRASRYFKIVGGVSSYAELVHALDQGDCQLGLVIAPDFARELRSGQTATVQALLDGTDSNTANIILGYARGVIGAYGQTVQLSAMSRLGMARPAQGLRAESRVWFNEDLESRNFLIPGLIAIVMATIGSMLTSLTIAREWERGTMEQLISTPVTRLEIILGKLVPYFFIGLLDTALCAMIGRWWFHVPFRGAPLLLLAASSLFLIVVLGLGFLISVVAKSQLVASQVALVATFLPAFLLSGFMFAIANMPYAIQLFTYIIPARYYVAILQALFLKGVGPEILKGELVVLAIFGVVVTLVASAKFSKKLS